MQPVVTVGLDGSPESLAAARWAADEAENRKLALRLLHAWPMLAPEPTRVPAEFDQNYWSKRLVHDAQTELQALHPGLSVITSLVADDAQNALLHAASESELTVLGSRGLESVQSYFLGDVSMPVVARAGRPVVLVRAEGREEGPSSAVPGRVVVALKLHGACDDLLDFAFHTAAARGVPLLAIHGRSVPLHAHVPWGGGPRHHPRDDAGRAAAAESIAPSLAREVPAGGGGRRHRSRKPGQGRRASGRRRRGAGRRPASMASWSGAPPGSCGAGRHPSRPLPRRRRSS